MAGSSRNSEKWQPRLGYFQPCSLTMNQMLWALTVTLGWPAGRALSGSTAEAPQDSWEWSQVAPAPGARPSARDFARLAALPGGSILLFGGLDASERRLDDAWVFDTARSDPGSACAA